MYTYLWWELLVYARQQQVELIHAHMIDAHIVGDIVAIMLGIPLVVSTHTAFDRYLSVSGYRRWLARWFSHRRTAAFILVAKNIGAKLNHRWKIPLEKCHIVPNGLNIVPFLNIPERIPDTRMTICNIASLSQKKGHAVLLDAATRVLANREDVDFLLLGEGSLRPQIEQQLEAQELQNQVTLLGFVPDPSPYLAKSDIFVLTSHVEGQPLALASAMAAGRPSVVTGVGGIPEMLDHGQEGLIVPPDNSSQVAEAILELLADPERRLKMGRRARRRALATFTSEQMAQRHLQVYLRVLAGGNK